MERGDFTAVAAEVGPAHVVDEDNDEIGLAGVAATASAATADPASEARARHESAVQRGMGREIMGGYFLFLVAGWSVPELVPGRVEAGSERSWGSLKTVSRSP